MTDSDMSEQWSSREQSPVLRSSISVLIVHAYSSIYVASAVSENGRANRTNSMPNEANGFVLFDFDLPVARKTS